MTLIVQGLITGLDVWKKSTPRVSWKPFAISLTLYFDMLLLRLYLTLNTYLFPTTFCAVSLWIKTQILLSRKASNSACITCLHLGSCKTNLTEAVLSSWLTSRYNLGLNRLTLDLVTIGWAFWTGWGISVVEDDGMLEKRHLRSVE